MDLKEKRRQEAICELYCNVSGTEVYGTFDTFLASRRISNDMAKMAVKMIAHVRDILRGKGDRLLCYRMIYACCRVNYRLGIMALRMILGISSNETAQMIGGHVIQRGVVFKNDGNAYGCWKDVKYFCDFVRKESPVGIQDPLIVAAMTLLNQQLYCDWTSRESGGSLACKWVPREKSKYGWLFSKMAIQWAELCYPYLLRSESGITKCKMKYRWILSSMNRSAHVAEVKKCGGQWLTISPCSVTMDSITRRNVPAVLNMNNAMEDRNIDSVKDDRYICANNYREFVRKGGDGGMSFSNHGVHAFVPGDFVKRAIDLLDVQSKTADIHVLQNVLYQMELVNAQFRHFLGNVDEINDAVLPVVDMSLSMSQDALCCAIGMGCVISLKSKLKHRVIVMDHDATWVNLDEYGTAYEFDLMGAVKLIYHDVHKRTAANLDHVIRFLSHTSNDVEFVEFSLIIFSNGSINEPLSTKYHCIFWNCDRGSSDLCHIGGTNAYLLNHGAIFKCTDIFDVVSGILNHPYYDKMGFAFDDVIRL